MYFFLPFIFLYYSSALYEDQVGTIDWTQRYIGHVDRVVFDSNVLISTSKKNIISGIDIHTGRIIWRHILDDNSNLENLLLCERTAITISSYGGVIRAWETTSGSLLWDVSTAEGYIENSHIQCNQDKIMYSHSKSNGVIGLYGEDHIQNKERIFHQIKTSYNDRTHTFIGKTTDGECMSLNEDLKWTPLKEGCRENEYFDEYSIFVENNSINLANFKSKKNAKIPNTENDSSISFIERDYLITKNPTSQTVYSYKNDALQKMGSIDIHSKMHRILNYDGNKYLVSLSYEAEKSFKNSKLTTYSLHENQLKLINSLDLHIPTHNGEISDLQVTIDEKSFGRVEELMRVFIFSSDYSITAFNGAGDKIWSREEALAHVICSEFADLPISDIQASIEEEFEDNTSILDMFTNRLKAQSHQVAIFFKTYLTSLMGSEASRKDSAVPSSSEEKKYFAYPEQIGDIKLSRDNFNLNKILVIVTDNGKIFGLESKSGHLVWTFKIPNAEPLRNLKDAQIFNQRTSSHHAAPPVTTVLMQNSSTKKKILVSFNPTTGVPINIEKQDTSLIPIVELPFDPIQVMVHPKTIDCHTSQNASKTTDSQKDIQHMNPLIFLGSDERVYVYPSKGSSLLRESLYQHGPLFFHVIENEECNVIGYRVSLSQMFYDEKMQSHYYRTKKIWALNLDNDQSPQRIIATSMKNPNEKVHSIGRVLEDRSVLYKYLNPNLIAIVTISKEEESQTFKFLQNPNANITVYLIDSVVGNVLHSVYHQKSGNPVSLVVSENWILYSYYSFKNARTELSLLELFEQKSRNDQLDTWSLFLRALTFNGPALNETQKVIQKVTSESPDDYLENMDEYLEREDLFTFSSISRDVSGIRTGPDGKTTTASQLLVPVVLTKSYLFGTALNRNSFAVSLTQKGITSKSVVMALKNGAIMEVPLSWLDPSISMELSPEAVTDSYQPEIPLSPMNFINYNCTMLNVRKIKTIPSGLESTSLIFAHGIDLFHTRIAPSKTFDLLKEDFDYFFISVVTLGMIVGTIITHQLAARKSMMRAWA